MHSRRVVVPGPRDVRATLDRPGGADGNDDASGDAGAEDGRDARSGAVVDRAVVACPPHPQHGGSRTDGRLRAVAEDLTERGVACLRLDYGDWDRGRGERTDAVRAVDWLADWYDRVGLFGYSFGGGIALLAGARLSGGRRSDGGQRSDRPASVSALAPASDLEGLDAAAAVEDLSCPLQVVYGSRDDTADWRPVVERAELRARFGSSDSSGGDGSGDRGSGDGGRESGASTAPTDTDPGGRADDAGRRRTDLRELSADHFFVGQRQAVARLVGEFLEETL